MAASIFTPLINGVFATVISSESSLFAPLQTVTNAGDNCVYAVIKGSSNLGVSLKNDSKSKKWVEVREGVRCNGHLHCNKLSECIPPCIVACLTPQLYVEDTLANAVFMEPHTSQSITSWSGGSVPIRLAPVIGSASAPALKPSLGGIRVVVTDVIPCAPMPAK